MSTLTSLIKSGKRKLIRTRTGQSSVEREQSGMEAGQKPLENAGSDAPVKPALGRPDEAVSLDATRPRRRTLSTNNPALGQPDEGVSPDVTRPQ